MPDNKKTQLLMMFISLLTLAVGQVHAASPIALWTFSEGDGNVVGDTAGVAAPPLDGVIIGATNWVTGLDGNALSFNGLTTYVSVPEPNQQADVGSAITIVSTFKLNSANVGGLVVKMPNSTSTGYRLMIESGHTVRADFRAGFVTRTLQYPVDPNGVGLVPAHPGWYHAAATYDGSVMRLFVNGSQVNETVEANVGIVNNDLGIIMGQLEVGSELYLDGIIDENAIYDVALSPAEVKALAQAKGLFTYIAPICGVTHLPPAGDLSSPPDCVMNMGDFAVMAAHWMEDTN